MSLVKLIRLWEDFWVRNDSHQRSGYRVPDEYWWDSLNLYIEQYRRTDGHWTMAHGSIDVAHQRVMEQIRILSRKDEAVPPPEDMMTELGRIHEYYLNLPDMFSIPIIPPSFDDLIMIAGITDEQIAKRLGFVNPSTGMGRADLVYKERKNRGSVITENYVHPQEMRRRADRARLEEDLQDVEPLDAPGVEAQASPGGYEKFVADVRSMYDLGMTPKEIASVLGVSSSVIEGLRPEGGVVSDSPAETSQADPQDAIEGQSDDSIESLPDELVDDLEAMSEESLRQRAADLGVTVSAKAKKETVIAKIRAAEAVSSESAS